MRRMCLAWIVAALFASTGAQTNDLPLQVESSTDGAIASAANPKFRNLDARGRIPGAYYVQFKSAATLSQIPAQDTLRFRVLPGTLPTSRENAEAVSWALAAEAQGTDVAPFFRKRRQGFTFQSLSEEKVSAMAEDPRVDFIEPIRSLRPLSQQALPGDNSVWGLDRIDQRQLPLNQKYDYATTATAVTVHVIDSGIRATHTEFVNRPQVHVDNCFTPLIDEHDCVVNFSNNPDVMDCLGHGTAVASLAGGTTLGVAKQVRLRGYIVTWGPIPDAIGWTCHPGPGDSLDLLAGIERATDAASLDFTNSIINISMEVDGISSAIDEAVQDAIDAGNTVVIAAGNGTAGGAPENACLNSPRGVLGAITVASSTQSDQRSLETNFGPCVDMFAPGHQLNTADVDHDTDTLVQSGSSLAAPIVAGIVALYYEDHPFHTPVTVQNAIIQAATPNVMQGNLGCANPPGGGCTPNRLAYSLLSGPASGIIQFALPAFSGTENGGFATVTASRSGNLSGAVSVTYNTSNGSATAGADYTPASGTLNWVSGDNGSKSFNVSMLNDSFFEGTETVNLALSNATGGAALGSQVNATLQIGDDEQPPGVIKLSASSYSVNEGAGNATITATRTDGSAGAVDVTYFASNGSATSGNDFTSALGTLSWSNGDTVNKSFVVGILDDASIESDETFSVSLSGPTGGATLGSPSLATVTINDNDTPLPSVPTNLRTSPVNISYGGTFSVLWNASTGTVNHYTLHETRTISGQGTTITTYNTTPSDNADSIPEGRF